jgi:MFS family permease
MFALLWAGSFVSNTGNWMENVGQQWAVQVGSRAHTGFMVELLNFADFSPALILTLLAGVIADRVNRRTYLLLLQCTLCVVSALLAVVGFKGHATPWVVIGFTFVEGLIIALNGPAWLSLVPDLVPRDELHKAIALNSVQFNMSRLIGPVLAGLVIAASSVNMAFAINAATFLFAIYALIRLPSEKFRTKNKTSPAWHDLVAGLSFVWRHRGTRQLALMSICFMFLSAPVLGLSSVFAHDVLHGGSSLYGLMLGAIGLGAVTGVLILGRIPRHYPRHHLIPLAMCCWCMAALLYSFSSAQTASLLLLFVCGIFWLLSLNPVNTANQLLAKDENRGRVISIMLLCNQGSMPLGHLFAGFLTHVMAPQVVVRVMVGTLLLAMSYFLFRREPAIDNMTPQDPEDLSWGGMIIEAVTARSHRPNESVAPEAGELG